ncbi:MAG: glycosyltransferase family 9 protein [Chitinophagaceae bacterium]
MFFSKIEPKHILIGRNDALGDAILALPCCGIIKKHYPDVEISFLGKTYTKAAIEMCGHVDHFINYDEIVSLDDKALQHFFAERRIDTVLLLRMQKELTLLIKRSGIPYRVGNFHFMRHLTACNRFVSFGHKSGLNEAQLNLKMLEPIGITEIPSRTELIPYYGIAKIPTLRQELKDKLSTTKFNIILHPMTTGNGPAWPDHCYRELITALDKNRYKIFLSGSPQDNRMIRRWHLAPEDAENLAGTTSLEDLIAFVYHSDGLLAGSTGPLHIAAAMGIHALGLYPSFPEGKAPDRWGPIGTLAETIVSTGAALDTISVETVKQHIDKWDKVIR